jgi:hypothetical protein
VVQTSDSARRLYVKMPCNPMRHPESGAGSDSGAFDLTVARGPVGMWGLFELMCLRSWQGGQLYGVWPTTPADAAPGTIMALLLH